MEEKQKCDDRSYLRPPGDIDYKRVVVGTSFAANSWSLCLDRQCSQQEENY